MAKALSNTITVDRLPDEIDELIEARVTWENGSYKASNDELYRLLERCTELLKQVQTERKLVRRIGTLLVERGITVRENTSLPVKIIRLVFGPGLRKRAFTYAKVISVAASDKRENESMRTFVNDHGGIEEVSRSKSNKGAGLTRDENVRYAIEKLTLAKPIIPEFDMVQLLQPHKESGHSYSLALVRRDVNGKGSAVFGISNRTLVTSALNYAAKQLRPKAEMEVEESKKQTRMSRRRSLVRNAKVKKGY